MNVKLLLLGVAALVILGGGALFWMNGTPVVTTAKPTRGPAVEAVYATGVVEPVKWAKVSPTVAGRIVSVEVREGDKVDAGAVLVVLDDREAAARLAETQARERFLAADLKRFKELAGRDFASRQKFELAQSELLQASAARRAAERHAEEFTLRSPMAGSVLKRDAEPGEVATAGQVLLWVGQCCPLRVTAEVEEEDIPRIKPGQTALIRADAFTGRVLEGEVAEITPKGDPINKVYRVRITLPDKSPLMIGMTTEVNVVVAQKEDALLVPRGSLKGESLWVLEGGQARLKPVRLGIVGRETAEVLEGLTEEDRIIIDPPEGLAEGDRVR